MAVNTYISDHVTLLRRRSAEALKVFDDATALTRTGTILGYYSEIAETDLVGLNADLDVADIANVKAFYDTIAAQLSDHPEQFQSLLKMARGGGTT
jgi:hypothetical protein